MPMNDFALAVERTARGTTVLVLGGELDLYTAPEIEEALAQAVESEPDRDRRRRACGAVSADGGEHPDEEGRLLVVDLCSVTFLDSSTLALLLAASRRESTRGGELLILVGPRTPMTAFTATGLDRLLSIRRLDADPGESAA